MCSSDLVHAVVGRTVFVADREDAGLHGRDRDTVARVRAERLSNVAPPARVRSTAATSARADPGHGDRVEHRRTLHLDALSELRFVSIEQVERCFEDPDRVEATRLSGGRQLGLLFSREFAEGVLGVVVRQEDDRAILVTAFWRRPRKRRSPRGRR